MGKKKGRGGGGGASGGGGTGENDGKSQEAQPQGAQAPPREQGGRGRGRGQAPTGQQGQGRPQGLQGQAGPQQGQGRPPSQQAPQQGQGRPPGQQGPPQVQGRPPGQQGPPQVQGRPPGQQGPQQGQGRPPGQQGPQQGQGRPPGQQGPPQVQGRPPGQQGPQQGQGRPPGQQAPQQEQGRPPGQQWPQQGQGRPPGQQGPQQGQGRPQGPQQGHGHPQGQQGQYYPQGPQQGQGRPPGPQQVQGHPQGQQGQYYPQGPPQGQQGQYYPQGPQQGQGRPPGPQQVQGHPQGQQGQFHPQGPPQGQQGQYYPQGPQQGQGRPPGPQQVQGHPQGQQGQFHPQGPQQGQGHPPNQQEQSNPQGPQQAQSHAPGPGQQGQSSQGPQQDLKTSAPSRHADTMEVQKRVAGLSIAPVFKIPTKADCVPAKKDGRPIGLEVNHLLVKVKDVAQNIHHYDVAIDPDKPKRLMRAAMEAARIALFPMQYPAFDGRKNLYYMGPLMKNNEAFVEVRVVDDERIDQEPKSFKVNIKLARSSLSLKSLINYLQGGASTNPPQDVIQAVDVVLRSASARRFVQVGRSFFCKPERFQDLGHGLELWLGFFQSFVMGQRPYLNIDVAHKGFPIQQSLKDLLLNMSDGRNDSDLSRALQYKRDDFAKFIRGLKIIYEIPGIPSSKRVYRVNNLVKDAIQERFDFNEKRISVGEYFEREKHYRVKHPSLPCVHVGAREKTIYVPMELCTILPGQATMKKMDETQTAAMVKLAATNVDDRKRKIKEAMKKASINSSPEVMQFGLSVDEEFAKVNGRILPPPSLLYQSQRIINPMKGVWRSGRFKNGITLSDWVVVDATGRARKDEVDKMEHAMMQEGQQLSMQIAPKKDFIQLDRRGDPGQVTQRLRKCFEDLKNKVQMAFVIIGGRDPQIYSLVKTAAEIHAGFLTQCVQDFTVSRKMNQSTVHNILLKVNSKLNGVNHTLASEKVFKDPKCSVLVIGADVTHPSPDSKDIPSVAAVTASHDINGFQYNPRIRLQPPRVEIIEDLKNIVAEQIMFFKQKTGAIPRHIIFYRDGVSEGQFQQVLDQELRAIREACIGCNKDYKPKITFLVVQKRHHTRFFPLNIKDSQDRNGNVPAGTIVDTDICHPTEIDFYLVSHASIQGVARPTKYHVLWDDSKMSENDLQLLTYGLCHLFTRCDRAVSYPAPTYYAHLAAARGRVYLENWKVNLLNLKKDEERIQNVVQNFYPMFFV